MPRRLLDVGERPKVDDPRVTALSQSRPEATVRDLQRAYGNRRVARLVSLSRAPAVTPAVERTTVANRRLAEEIDAMRKLKDAALLRRRAEVERALASGVDGDERARLVRTQDAIDFVAAERSDTGFVPRAAPTNDPAVARRLVAERIVQLERSVKRGLERLSGMGEHDPEYRRQAERIKAEADAFSVEFEHQAKLNAQNILNGSARAIFGVLGSYGLPTRSKAWTEDKDAFARQATEWLELAHKVDDYRAAYESPEARTHRERLGQWVAHLQQLQHKLKLREQELAPGAGAGSRAPPLDPSERDRARRKLEAAWIEAERHHQILAAYRSGDASLESIDLGALARGGDEAMRAVLLRAMPKVANILDAKRWLDQGKTSPLSLGPVVALTRLHMFVAPGSVRDAAVNDLVDDAGSSAGWVLGAITLALSLLLLVPTGGASLAVPGLLALDVYTGLSQLVEHGRQKAMTDTDLDQARSLSDEEPSLTGFAITLVSLGLQGVSLLKAFRQAVALRRLAMEGGESDAVRRALKQLLEEHGVTDVNAELREIEQGERAGTRVSEPGEPAKTPTPKPAEKPWTPPIPVRVRTLPFKSADEVKAAVIRELSTGATHGMMPSQMPPDWMSVFDALAQNGASNLKVNPQIRKALLTVMGGLRDPKLYAEVLAEAWQRAMRSNGSINHGLLEMALEGGMTSRSSHGGRACSTRPRSSRSTRPTRPSSSTSRCSATRTAP